MTTAFYDVVVLGSRLPGLVCSALLAKHGFRVLVLGQDDPGPTYRIGGYTFARAPFDFVAAHTPVVQRTMNELALLQQQKRRVRGRTVGTQVCLPNTRFELCPEADALEREIQREFPEVKRPIEDIHRVVTRANVALDAMTERDLTWPPEGFFDRRAFQRAASGAPFAVRGNDAWDPIGELAEDHPFRHVVQTPARFSSALDPGQLSGIGIARPDAAWLAGGLKIEGGYAWLRKQFVERLEAYSGELRPRERADRIHLRRDAVSGVRIASTGETVGARYVVAACDLARLLRIVPDRAPFEDVFERIGEPQPRYYRFTTNLVLRARGIPEGMGHDVFAVTDTDRNRAPESMLHIERSDPDEAGLVTLCVQSLLPRRMVEDAAHGLEDVRDRVLDGVRTVVPFLDEHLVFVDSPHDGREGYDVAARASVQADEPWMRGPESMEAIYGYPVRGMLGVCAMPVRTPFARLFLCNEQVVPGLGLEGAWLAAASVARLVARSDRRKEWMRRGLFSKPGA